LCSSPVRKKYEEALGLARFWEPFEMCLAQAPRLDGSLRFAGMLYTVTGFSGFEQGVFCATRVRYVSRVGSQTFCGELSRPVI
jgi:hypothetical protein